MAPGEGLSSNKVRQAPEQGAQRDLERTGPDSGPIWALPRIANSGRTQKLSRSLAGVHRAPSTDL